MKHYTKKLFGGSAVHRFVLKTSSIVVTELQLSEAPVAPQHPQVQHVLPALPQLQALAFSQQAVNFPPPEHSQGDYSNFLSQQLTQDLSQGLSQQSHNQGFSQQSQHGLL
jgi:hypothetical protein